MKDDMYLAKEESFGPIMVISKFDAGDVEGVVIRYKVNYRIRL